MRRCLNVCIILFLGVILISASKERMQDTNTMDLIVKPQDIQSTCTVKPDLNFGKFPLYFIFNKGQVNEKAKFYAKASRYTLWLTKQGLIFDSIRGQGSGVSGQDEKATPSHSPKIGATKSPSHQENSKDKEGIHHSSFITHHLSPHPLAKYNRDVSRLMFIGANKNPEIVPLKQSKLKVNYFIGNDRSKWHCDIPTSQAILYKNLYKNIDLKVYGIEKQIEYDWIVKPGGNPEDIRVEYKNVKRTRLDDEGNLIVKTDFGELKHKKPVSFQEIGDEKVEIKAKFKKIKKNTYGFEVDEYDKSYELIIDPVVLAYSTYLGGDTNDYGWGIALDKIGNVYVSGYTNSTDFPILNQYQTLQNYPYWDIFITKIDMTKSGLSSLIYSTYLGGGNTDFCLGIAVDRNGNAYVTGNTYSSDFPTINQYQTHQPSSDVFLAKINTLKTGSSSLVYSTYLGGESDDYGEGIAVDRSGNAYVTGWTNSTNFPCLNQFHTDYGRGDAFVTKIDTTKSGTSSLIYSTYLGGSSNDFGEDIAVDNRGNAYVVGETKSTDFPCLNQFQTDWDGIVSDAFVTKIDTTKSGASSLIYSTYLGGRSDDFGKSIAVGSRGNAYVTGYTNSTNFPCLNQFQTDQRLGDVFVTKIDTTKSGSSSLIYSTYLGGRSWDESKGIALGSIGNAYVTGDTYSTDFPRLHQFQNYQGSSEVFVTKIDTTQSGDSSLIYSTYLGGGATDRGNGIAVDNGGNAYVTGYTFSTDFPCKNQYQTDQVSYDAFVTKLSYSPLSLTVISPNGNENWHKNTIQDITWDAGEVLGNLKITLWKDGARVGVIVTGVDPASGFYPWSVGQYKGGTAQKGSGYTIKIKEIGTTVSDVSDSSFGIKSQYGVLSPNGGENWRLGYTENITWKTPTSIGLLKITLWKGGAGVGTIATNVDSTLGSFTWTVGQHSGGKAVPGTDYTIKIKEIGTKVSDESDRYFTLSQPWITVTLPNGGENWILGNTENITWDSSGVSGNLTITLWRNGAKLGKIAIDVDPTTGSYSWTVGQHSGGTAPAGTRYTIKIKEQGTTVFDESDLSFTLIE